MARRTKEEAEQTRCALLGAAVDVFFERGVARASLEEVARAASVTRGALYWHFKDKLDLFLAIDACARLPAEELMSQLAAYQGDDPVGGLERALTEIFTALDDDADRRRVLAVVLTRCEYTAEMAPVVARQRAHDARLLDAMKATFEAATRRPPGMAPGWNPQTAAEALYALTLGLIHQWLRTEKPGFADEANRVIRAFLGGIRRATDPAAGG